jgi:hypothetical protein
MDMVTRQRIEAILKELPSCGGDTPENRRDQLVAMLHSLIAEQQAKSAEKLEQQTIVLIRFTKLLVGLTWALIFLGIIQIVMMFCKPVN